MSQISFFTPLEFKKAETFLQKSLEKVDHYFYLGGKKAIVLSDDTIVLQKGESSLLSTAAKVLSYATVVLPLIMLIAKAALRFAHKVSKYENILNEVDKKVSKQIDSTTTKAADLANDVSGRVEQGAQKTADKTGGLLSRFRRHKTSSQPSTPTQPSGDREVASSAPNPLSPAIDKSSTLPVREESSSENVENTPQKRGKLKRMLGLGKPKGEKNAEKPALGSPVTSEESQGERKESVG